MNGWDEFTAYLEHARARLEDRWAPVAVICLQAESHTNEDGVVNVKPWNDAAVIWPASFPVSERGPLLERLAKPYRDHTVLQS